MAHAGEEGGLRDARALGLQRRGAELRAGLQVLGDLGLDLGLRGENLGVEQRHHRDIDRGADDRDDADALHLRKRDARGEAAAQQIELGKAAEAHADLQQDDDAAANAGAEIEERQQRNRDQPRQERRRRPAIEVAAPQNGEEQDLHRDVAQQRVASGEFEQERKHPEERDRQRQHQQRRAGLGIEPEQIGRNDIAKNRAEHVTDEKHARAGAHLSLGKQFIRDEPVDNSIRRIDERHRLAPSFAG